MQDKDKIYWLRSAMGFLAGILCTALGFYGEIGGRGITLGVGLYIITYFLVKHLYKIGINPAKGITSNTLLITGFGTYIITWLFTWILLVNILFF